MAIQPYQIEIESRGEVITYRSGGRKLSVWDFSDSKDGFWISSQALDAWGDGTPLTAEERVNAEAAFREYIPTIFSGGKRIVFYTTRKEQGLKRYSFNKSLALIEEKLIITADDIAKVRDSEYFLESADKRAPVGYSFRSAPMWSSRRNEFAGVISSGEHSTVLVMRVSSPFEREVKTVGDSLRYAEIVSFEGSILTLSHSGLFGLRKKTQVDTTNLAFLPDDDIDFDDVECEDGIISDPDEGA